MLAVLQASAVCLRNVADVFNYCSLNLASTLTAIGTGAKAEAIAHTLRAEEKVRLLRMPRGSVR